MSPPSSPSSSQGPVDDSAHSATSGHLALLLAMVFFGLFPIFGKLAMHGISPTVLTGLRILTGSLVLTTLALVVHGRKALPRRSELPALFLCALLGVLFNQLLYLKGLQLSTAVNAGLIICTIPVFTFAIAAAIGQERFAGQRALGIGLALVGCLLLFFDKHPDLDLRREHLQGNLLMVANCLLYSAYLVLSRPLTRRMPPLVVIAWVYALCLPAVPFLLRERPLWPVDAGPSTWLSLGYVLIFPTVLAYLLISFALSRLHASTTAVYNYLQPLVAGLGAFLVLHEELRPAAFAAAALMFLGIWLVARESRARAAPSQRARPQG